MACTRFDPDPDDPIERKLQELQAEALRRYLEKSGMLEKLRASPLYGLMAETETDTRSPSRAERGASIAQILLNLKSAILDAILHNSDVIQQTQSISAQRTENYLLEVERELNELHQLIPKDILHKAGSQE